MRKFADRVAQRVFLSLVVLSFGLAHAKAEHRVALAIGDDSIVPNLEQLGYRCQVSDNLSEKEFVRLIDSFAGRTPTNGTALLYFKGEVREEDGDLQFITANSRTVALSQVVESLQNRGGSTNDRIIVESPEKPTFEPDLPDGVYFSYADEAELAPDSTASIAISPPEKFVPGKKVGDEWVNTRGMVFCWCPPGKYTAGSPEGTPGRFTDEEQREVIIEDGFWIGKYELTNSEDARGNGRKTSAEDKNLPLTDRHWDDGRPMASRTLTEEERKAGRLSSGWQYDLPSSDQWEYAARAGTSTLYYFGDGIEMLPEHANFADRSLYETKGIFSNYAHRVLDDGFAGLSPVGQFKANPWGLFDIYGNATEWCRDYGAVGGSYLSEGKNCRSGYRDSRSSRDQQAFLGYRLVIQPNVPDPPKK